MPTAIRTMENKPPPLKWKDNIKDKLFFFYNMRRLHGHRTFTDMTNSIRPSFDSARNEKQGMNGTIIRLAIRKRSN